MSLYTHECALCEEKESSDYYAQVSNDFWLCQDCKDKMRVLLGIELKYGCEEYREGVCKEIGRNLLYKVIRKGMRG